MSLDVRYINHYHIFHLINTEKSVKKAKENYDSTAGSMPWICKGDKGNFTSALPSAAPTLPAALSSQSHPLLRRCLCITDPRARAICSPHVHRKKKKNKQQHFQRLWAFLSVCENILIAIKEMTTPSLDIIKRWGAFLDTLTSVHAGTWEHVIFIGIYFVVKVMRNIFSRVITI